MYLTSAFLTQNSIGEIMTCDCSNFERGRWSNGQQTIFWAVNSRCKKRTIEWPVGFSSSDLEAIEFDEIGGGEVQDIPSGEFGQALLFEKLAKVLDETPIDGEDPELVRASLAEFLKAPGGNRVSMCCVKYSLRWLPIGFRAGELVRLKKFTVGGDSFGPYPAYGIPGPPARPVAQTHVGDLCKSNADCDTITTPVLEFDVTRGGAGAAGATTPLGTVSGFKTCRLSATE
ncbi:hypothetical protein [Arenibacterium sp. CAU 1754]